jgi:uncharacterized protein
MKKLIALALLTGTALAHAQTAAPAPTTPSSPAKKELVAKIVALQQPAIDNLARGIAERPAAQMMQAAGNVLQTKVPPEKREAIGKAIEADVKKYVDESTPILRDRAAKIGPATVGPIIEERFSEDELKQLAAWLESPVNKKYQQVAPEMQQALVQKLVAEAGPLLDPKLKVLEQKVRVALGVPPVQPGQTGSGAAPAPAKKAASK